jgi:iron(III) transport system ATP-binding protein
MVPAPGNGTLLPSRRLPTAIEIRSITKVFPPTAGAPGAPAVDNISLTIEPGELFFLLGPSGCGKTTLLRMIAGFIEPTSGQILFREGSTTRDVTHLPAEKRNTAMVFQSYALWPHMTVAENVAFGLRVRGVGADERIRRVKEALTTVHMEALANRKPTQLSGGQQQRVALARALVIRPSVLLLDEPLSNLDAKLRHELRSEIRRICKRAEMTTVYVTHDQKEALSMADRIAVLAGGRAIQVGRPEDLYRRPSSRFVAEFLGEANFLRGRVVMSNSQHTKVQMSSGFITAQTPNFPVQIGSDVTIMIRPESLRIGTNVEGIAGRVDEALYLGEMTSIRVLIGDGISLNMAIFNSSRIDDAMIGHNVVLVADPSDVLILPDR